MTTFTTPVARLLAGDIYTANTTDFHGKPLTSKNGQPRVEYWVQIAITKGSEQNWEQTSWGTVIYQEGASKNPSGYQRPDFAWKVIDGDSTGLDQKGVRWCDKENYPKNWILSFKSAFAPQIVNKDGSIYLTEPGAVKLGYYVQIFGDVNCDDRKVNPGVYLNLKAIALSAEGPIIQPRLNLSAAGFGAAPLPAGATPITPAVAGFAPLIPSAPAPAAPATPLPPVAAPSPAPAIPAPPAPPSNPAILHIPKLTLTEKAGVGMTFDILYQAGWNDQLLIEHGMAVMQ